jgi:hypothetical protein
MNASPLLTLEQKAGLEFAFLEALARPWDRHSSSYGIPNLERYVEAHPEMYVQVLAWAYKRKDGALDRPNFRRRRIAQKISWNVVISCWKPSNAFPDTTILANCNWTASRNGLPRTRGQCRTRSSRYRGPLHRQNAGECSRQRRHLAVRARARGNGRNLIRVHDGRRAYRRLQLARRALARRRR